MKAKRHAGVVHDSASVGLAIGAIAISLAWAGFALGSPKKRREDFCVAKWVEAVRLESGYVMSPAQIALINRTNVVKDCADTVAEVDAIKAGKPWPPPQPPPVRPTITRFFPTWDACFKGGGASAGASLFGDCDGYCYARGGAVLGRISAPGAPHEPCATVTEEAAK